MKIKLDPAGAELEPDGDPENEDDLAKDQIPF